jgi:hypothetical protein
MASSCSIGGAASHKRAKLSLIVLAFLAEVDESSQDEHRFICVACAASVDPSDCLSFLYRVVSSVNIQAEEVYE